MSNQSTNKEEQESSKTAPTPISPSTIEAVVKAMQETGINPIHFIELFSMSQPLTVFSRYRYLVFQGLYEKYRSEAEIGSIHPELAEYASVLYDVFYETEKEYLQYETHKQNKQMLGEVMQVLKDEFGFDAAGLETFNRKFEEEKQGG